MNIKELIASTATVHHYGGGKDSFKSKPFGSIFFFNKEVKAKGNTIEVSMMTKATTDKVQASAGAPPRAVAAHLTKVTITGVEQETVDEDELVARIRNVDDAYKDEKAYPNDMLIEMAIGSKNEGSNAKKFFEGKTVMKGDMPWRYVIVTDKISDEAEIRVWCSCSAYYWAFQFYNVENKADIYGKYPERYTPKTKKGFEALRTNTPMRNPGRKPGCCKHILMLLAMLMDNDVIQPSKGGTNKILSGYRMNISRFDRVKKLSKSGKEQLLSRYKSDHDEKTSQRKYYRESAGYSKDEKKNSWSRKNKWVPPKNGRAGYWKTK